MAASLIAGCTIGEKTVDTFLSEKGARDQYVTYYANGGYFNGMTSLTTKDMYYPENAYVIVDFANTENISVDRFGYVFEGWYVVEQDEDGNAVYEDADKLTVKLTDTVISEEYRIQKDEHLLVGAKWSLDLHVDILLVCDSEITGADGVIYQNGSTIATESFSSSGTLTLKDSTPLESSDHSFLQYYYDAECTQPYEGAKLTKPTGENAQDIVIYAKYIEGIWTVVKNASDVMSMYSSSSNTTQYYVFNDIDCTGNKSVILNSNEFNLTIEGNGHTITGLSLAPASAVTGNLSYAIFGNMGESAKVRNLTLKDINITASIKTGWSAIYLLCYDISEDTRFENFAIDGAEISIKYPSDSAAISNIQMNTDGEYVTDNWIAGGVADESGATTDEAFLAVYDGITLTGVTLTINNEEVANFTNI